MAEDALLKDLRRRMEGAFEALRKEFSGLRTGRASASLLDPVTVEAYGNVMPLNQLATVSVPEPRLISVTVWDRAMAKAVDKAIHLAGSAPQAAARYPGADRRVHPEDRGLAGAKGQRNPAGLSG